MDRKSSAGSHRHRYTYKHGNIPLLRGFYSVLTALCIFFVLTTCDDFDIYSVLGEDNVNSTIITKGTLTIIPSAVTLYPGSSVTFSGTGGAPPYEFSISSGGGTIDSSTGEYTAPDSPGTATVSVTDSEGSIASAAVTVTEGGTGELSISPNSATVPAGYSQGFWASGGTPPYTFTIETSGSGSPTINQTEDDYAIYTAGLSAGTDTVKVTDDNEDSVPASVTVTLGLNPNYSLSSENLPKYGLLSTAFTGDFTISETAGNDGNRTIHWKLYISADTQLDGTDFPEVDYGSEPPLEASASTPPLDISGMWPAVENQYLYLLVQLNSDDDSDWTDNFYFTDMIPIPSSTFAETEPNDSPPPPAETASYHDLGALADGTITMVTGEMDGAADTYDTFLFTTDSGVIKKLDIICKWSTEADDIDLYVWEDGAVTIEDSSEEEIIAREPGSGTFKIVGLSGMTDYRIGVRFKSGATGTYQLFINAT